MKRAPLQLLSRTTCLLAVLLWYAAAGWHGAFHPNHHPAEEHHHCDAVHAPAPHDSTETWAGHHEASAPAGADATCLACAVASTPAIAAESLGSVAFGQTADAALQSPGRRVPTAPGNVFHLRGPPA